MPDFSRPYWKWIIVACCAIYCLLEASDTGDLYIYLSAASDVGTGIDIFEKKYVDGYHYFYSVAFALFLKPFASLPYFGVRFCWIFLNSLLFFHLLKLLYKSAYVSQLPVEKRNWFVFLVFIVSLRFFADNIHTSQITILILWCCVYGLYLIFNEQEFSGSLLLAIGINIKLLPLVFVPYLLYRAKWKSVFFVIGFYVLLMLLPSLFIGHAENMRLLSTWAHLINPANQGHILDVEERSFHGLSTLLSTLLVENVPDVYALPLKRNIADVNLETLSKIILAVRAVLILFTLYFLRLVPFRNSSGRHTLYEISYILLIIPLIFPHQQHYAFLFCVPAYTLLLYELLHESKPNKFTVFFLVMLYIIFSLKLLLGAYNDYYDHYKIITYAALMLVPALALSFRKKVID